MSYEKATIISTLSKIQNRELVLPAIQRDFVWEPERMYKLLDSIFRGYPFSTLLFWNTKQRVQFREFTKDWSDEYQFTYQVKQEGVKGTMVLDGQQRLQTLYLAIYGSYEQKILYFDLLSGIEPDDVSQAKYHFEFLTPVEAGQRNSQQGTTRHWIPLRELADLTRLQIAQRAIQYLTFLGIPGDSDTGQRLSQNVAAVFGSMRADETLNYFTIDKEYGDDGLETSLDEILEIFVRVNSGGQVLSKSDLMFSLMQMLWEGAADAIAELIDLLNRQGHYDFDKDFVLKCALVCCGKGARYEVGKLREEKTVRLIEDRFPAIRQAMENCLEFVVSKARFLDDRILRSYNALIPLIYFFYLQPNQQVKSEETLFRMKQVLYISLMTGLYGRAADNIIDQLVNNVIHTEHDKAPGRFPLEECLEFIHKRQGRSELDDWLLQNNINYLMNILEGGTQLPDGRRMRRPEVDHIFPHSRLQALGYPEALVNHYANFRLISRPENNWKRAQDPGPYFAQNPKSASYYFIPLDLLNYGQYQQFLDQRRALIWDHLRRFFGQDAPAGADRRDPVVAPGTPQPLGASAPVIPSKPSGLRKVLDEMLTPEQKSLPVLNDTSSWLSIYKGVGFSKAWCSRYERALQGVGIYTVGDFAAAIMALGLKLTAVEYEKFYQLSQPLPSGQSTFIPTREFGGYAWERALKTLKERGLDWENYLVSRR